MRTTLKIVLPLIISVVVVSLLFAGYNVRTQRKSLLGELSLNAVSLAVNLQENIESLPDRNLDKNLQRLVDRIGQRERLKGIVVYDLDGKLLAATSGLSPALRARPSVAMRAAQTSTGYGEFTKIDKAPVHLYALPYERDGVPGGTLMLVHDTSFIDTKVALTLRDSLLGALVQTLLISFLALILVRWTLTGPLTNTAKWLRTLRTGQTQAQNLPTLPEGELFQQIHQEVTHLARDLNAARASAEEEARLRESNVSVWTADRLRVSLSNKLQNKPLFVVSNREPYMHVFNNGNSGAMQVIVPASGLVTALEPVLQASNGTR